MIDKKIDFHVIYGAKLEKNGVPFLHQPHILHTIKKSFRRRGGGYEFHPRAARRYFPLGEVRMTEKV